MYPFCAIQNSWSGVFDVINISRDATMMQGLSAAMMQGLSSTKIRLVLCNTLRKGDVFSQNYLTILELKSYPTTLWHCFGCDRVRLSPLGLYYVLSNLAGGGGEQQQLILEFGTLLFVFLLPWHSPTQREHQVHACFCSLCQPSCLAGW